METAEPPPVPSTFAPIRCPRCCVELSPPKGEGTNILQCEVCHTEVTTIAFPKLNTGESRSKKSTLELPASGDAVCRFFPELKAEKICDECGSFLSEKAAVSWNAMTYCMPCLHTLRNQKKDDSFSAERRLYDNIALSLVTWGLPFSLFTAPVALFFLFRYRKASRGIIPRGAARWWIALVLALSLSIFWMAMILIWASSIYTNLS